MSRKRYTPEFRIEAMKLIEAIGITKASIELGVTSKTLRTWSESTSSNGPKNSKDSKIAELEAELRRSKKRE